MRIGIDIQTAHKLKTGFGNYVSSLIKYLNKVDKKNEYFYFKPTEKTDLNTPKRIWWDQFVLPNILKKNNIDLFHQPCFSVPFFYKGKKIVTVHDLAIKHYPKGIPLPSRTFFSYFMPFTYKYADHIITISNYTKKDIIKYLKIPKDKIDVIHLAVDQDLYNTKKIDKHFSQQTIKKYNICNKYFLTVSELHPRKNLEFLIKVFAKFSKKFSNYQMVLTGKPNQYSKKLKKIAEDYNISQKVIFSGYVSDDEKIILYKNCQIFLYPSLFEGFGLPPLEAMACGVPVISSNTSSLSEIIQDGGVLVKPDSVDEWIYAITKIITNKSFNSNLKAKATRQSKKFSWEKCANTTIEVYKKVLDIRQNKNILIIKNPFESQGYSGGEVHTMQIAQHLRTCGHNVFFAGSCPDLLNKAKEKGFKTEFIDFGGQEAVTEKSLLKFIFTWPFIYFKYVSYLKKVKKEKKIDILYLISWNEKFLLAPIATKLGMKVFFVEHRLMGRFIFWNPFRFFYQYGSNFAKIIAVSNAVEKGLIKVGIKKERIRVIHNGVEIKQFSQNKNIMFRKKTNEIVVGTVSRLSDDKGIKYLLEGFKIASCKNSNLRLKIIGSGPKEKEFKNLSKDLGLSDKVEFLGRVDRKKIPNFLNSIDIFILTSVWGESFGIVLVEAGIMEKPCITTNIGGMPEVVLNNKTGLIIKPYSSQDVSDALAKLAKNKKLRINMGKEAARRVKNNFSLEKMLKQIDNLFFSEQN